MNITNHQSKSLLIEQASGETVLIEGELTHANMAEFESQLRALNVKRDRAIALDLSGFDIDDGVALATAINSLRELRGCTARLILKGAPQILGHNLYRVGLLDGPGAIELIDMRQDEPTGF